MTDGTGSGAGRMVSRAEDGVGWMIFDHQARRNAVTYDMRRRIPGILAGFEADEDVRVVVLAGAGDKAFVSGSDISQFAAKRSSEEARRLYDEASEAAARALASFPKPMIAMIRGYCLGAGVLAAMHADIRVAADDASFGVPPARLGIGLGYRAVADLVAAVGPGRAAEILFAGERHSAADALAMGLVNRVVPAAELEAATTALARTIAGNAPLTLRALKTSIRAALADESGRDMGRVREQIEACFASEDYAEGRRAFLEKRRPVFRGR